MTRGSSTVNLFLVACILACAIWFLEWRPSDHKEARQRPRVLEFNADNVRHLMIERDKLRMDCIKKDGSWFIERPIRAKADDGQVERILSGLEAMPCGEIITPEQYRERELGLGDYGLLAPRCRFVMDSQLGREEVLIGGDAPLGELVYVKLADSDEVIATAKSVLDLAPAAIENLRDRTILHGTAEATTRIEIHKKGGGFIQLAQVDGRWMIQQPAVARADGQIIRRILDSIYALKAESFVWDPIVDPTARKEVAVPQAQEGASVELYGLAADEANASVKVWVRGDEVGKALFFGKAVPEDAKQVYVKRGDADGIYTINGEILDAFSLEVNDLRDRMVFACEPATVTRAIFREGDKKIVLGKKPDAGWLMLEPAQWKADDAIVEDLLAGITHLSADGYVAGGSTNLAAYGLAPAAYTIQLLEGSLETPPASNGAAAVPAAAAPAESSAGRLLIAALAPDAKKAFAKFEDDPIIIELSAPAVAAIVSRLTESLVYRDRTMLAILPENIRRIEVVMNGGEEKLERDAAGAWAVMAPAGATINNEAVNDMLLLAANLKALRVEATEPKTLAGCGLDVPMATISFGLSGEAAIRKSLLLGFRAKTDGVYAMVQGDDTVFVLENAVIERLTRALTVPGVTVSETRQP